MVYWYLVCPSWGDPPSGFNAQGHSSARFSLPCASDSSCPSHCSLSALRPTRFPSDRSFEHHVRSQIHCLSLCARLIAAADVVTIDRDPASAVRHLTVEGYSGDATSGSDNVSESYALPDSDISDESSRNITLQRAYAFHRQGVDQAISRKAWRYRRHG